MSQLGHMTDSQTLLRDYMSGAFSIVLTEILAYISPILPLGRIHNYPIQIRTFVIKPVI